MHAVVCIKQVPDTTEVKIDSEKKTLIREGIPSVINPFDEYAIEEALLTKERLGGKVTVLTMGPPQAVEALRTALAMGVDEAILLSDKAFAGSDTLATSYTLSLAIRRLAPVDLIFCGKQAIDGDTGQVGPGIARRLGISQFTYVSKVKEIDLENGKIRVERLLEGGLQIVEGRLPALLTVVKDINQPRLPSILRIKRVKNVQIPTWTAEDIDAEPGMTGLDGSPTQVVKVFTPEKRRSGEILRGSPEAAAVQLVERLLEAKAV